MSPVRAESTEEALPIPPETVTYRPFKAGINVHPETGAVTFLFLVSPLKYIEVIVPAEAAAGLAEGIPSVSSIITPGKPRIVVPS